MKKCGVRKSNFMRTFLLLIFSLFLMGEVSATIFYVAPTGNDSNSGSKTAPFRTIQRAADIVNPGDTVIVADGIYNDVIRRGDAKQNLFISRGGTSQNWITFRAENTWGAKLDGQNDVDFCVMFTYPVSYVRFEGFEIYNCCNQSAGAGDGIFINTDIQSNCDSSHAHDIYLYKLKIHDICRIQTNQGYGMAGIDGDRCTGPVTIDSCVFYNIGRLNPYTTPSASEASCTDSSVICYNHDAAIYFRSSNYTVINNIFYPEIKSGWPIQPWPNYGNISNTKIVNNTFYGQNPQRGGHVIFPNEEYVITDIFVENNIFHTPSNYAIGYNSSVTSAIIKNNLVYGVSLINETGCSNPKYTCSGNITGQDPKFVDSGKRNFHLQSGSPAIDKGLVFSGRIKDADGNSIVGAPDIGAYEAGGVTEDTTPPAPPTIIEVQ